MKRVKIKTFVWSSKQTIQFVIGKELRVEETRNIVFKLRIGCLQYTGEVIGCYELSAVPHCLQTAEGMHIHGGDGKSDLVTAIIKNKPDVEAVITVPNSVSGKQILVIDAMFLVHQKCELPENIKTCKRI